jgi:hypothetical protein
MLVDFFKFHITRIRNSYNHIGNRKFRFKGIFKGYAYLLINKFFQIRYFTFIIKVLTPFRTFSMELNTIIITSKNLSILFLIAIVNL